MVEAARDSAFEASILACLPPHENIVHLHGWSAGFLENPKQGFLLLDRLAQTLSFRLYRLKVSKNLQAPSGMPSGKRRLGFFKNRAQHQLDQMREQRQRIRHIGLGVARAMEFLHSHNVIYRDLKPQNVGFDETDTVRLFDFGLTRILKTSTYDAPERRLTGFTGTARYMAPEVARSEHYYYSSDVHSFAIMLWEVITLERPYASFDSLDILFKKAVHGNARPSTRNISSKSIKEVLEICWHPDPSARPSFGLIVKQLEQETATTV